MTGDEAKFLCATAALPQVGFEPFTGHPRQHGAESDKVDQHDRLIVPKEE